MIEQAIQEQIKAIVGADLLIGVPSYNNARTIGHVVKALQAGLAKYFPELKAVIVNSDGGSTDNTIEIVQNTTIGDSHSILLRHKFEHQFKLAVPYHGIPGKGSAFKTIFEIAAALNAKACVVVDADLRSITPEWVELLAGPVLDGSCDYVAPSYKRHKYDGTITNAIIYPLTRALYGKRVRQPIGGDFGFRGELANLYLSKNVWETDVARYGIDIWMTTTAIANGFTVSQSFLGAKIHDAKDPSADLSSMLFQVVGAAFSLMEDYHDVWQKVSGSQAIPAFGFEYEVGLEPVPVNLERMLERFGLGVKELSGIWQQILSGELVGFLNEASALPTDQFQIPDAEWAEIIYSFAIATHKKTMNREHLLRSLTPLYLGKVASFIVATRESDAADVEDKIERLCVAFEERKPFLIENW